MSSPSARSWGTTCDHPHRPPFREPEGRGQGRLRDLRHGRRSRLRDLARHPQAPARGRRRRDRARHALFRSDGRRPGDPGLVPSCAPRRPDTAQDARHGRGVPVGRRRHPDRIDGLLQPDLLLRARAFPRRGAGRRRRWADRRRPAAGGGRRLCVPALERGLNFIRLATPTTDDRRLPRVLENTSGFVYYVSITGITGHARADVAAVAEAVARIKRHTDLPVAVGSASGRPSRRAPSPRAPTASWSVRRSSRRCGRASTPT